MLRDELLEEYQTDPVVRASLQHQAAAEAGDRETLLSLVRVMARRQRETYAQLAEAEARRPIVLRLDAEARTFEPDPERVGGRE